MIFFKTIKCMSRSGIFSWVTQSSLRWLIVFSHFPICLSFAWVSLCDPTFSYLMAFICLSQFLKLSLSNTIACSCSSIACWCSFYVLYKIYALGFLVCTVISIATSTLMTTSCGFLPPPNMPDQVLVKPTANTSHFAWLLCNWKWMTLSLIFSMCKGWFCTSNTVSRFFYRQ